MALQMLYSKFMLISRGQSAISKKECYRYLKRIKEPLLDWLWAVILHDRSSVSFEFGNYVDFCERFASYPSKPELVRQCKQRRRPSDASLSRAQNAQFDVLARVLFVFRRALLSSSHFVVVVAVVARTNSFASHRCRCRRAATTTAGTTPIAVAYELFDLGGQENVSRDDTDRVLKAAKANAALLESFDATVCAAHVAQFWELAKSKVLNAREFRTLLETLKPIGQRC